jgi:CheY-like chemotaxis protein
MLDDIGYGVIEAEDAFRALEVIASPARISILLTDQAMPGLTGVQLAEAAKRLRPRFR